MSGGTSQSDLSLPGSRPDHYSFDFSESASGGVNVGNFINLAVAFDTRAPTAKYALPDSHSITKPNLLVSYDLADCTAGNAAVSAEQLPVKDSVAVAFVDLEMHPPTGKKLGGPGAGACFGWRDEAAEWHWNRALTEIVLDPTSGTYRAHVVVNQDGVTGLKLLFNSSLAYVNGLNISSKP